MPEKITFTFLGTSDAIPTVERNHTSVLLRYKDENILIDCGEGTQRQFKRAGLSISRITRILITHFHGDHIFGLPGLLQSLSGGGHKKTLYIYGPRGIKEFMNKLLETFLFHRDYKIEVKEAEGKFFETRDFYLAAERMTHAIHCNAYSFVKKGQIRIDKSKLRKEKIPPGPWLKNLKEGKDILYNGRKYLAKKLTYGETDRKISFVFDTSFNKNIASFVKNSDLLVSEATWDSSFKDLVKDRKHLTAELAAKLAKSSKSKELILTHFSQRYKNIKDLENEARKVFPNTALAEDFMQINI